MKIASYTPYRCGTQQESLLVLMHAMRRVVTKECVFHKGYAELCEKEQHAIEFLAPTIFKNFVWWSITIEIDITESDLIRLRTIKQRLQLIKQLVMRYTRMSLDWSACARSQLPTKPYTRTVTCFILEKSREVVRAKNLTPLEQLYIVYYQMLQILCVRWSNTMNVSPIIGSREQLPVSLSSEQKKVALGVL